MMTHIIGAMAMIFGFVSMAIQNYGGACVCFGFAFILWVVLAIHEYRHTRTSKERRWECQRDE